MLLRQTLSIAHNALAEVLRAPVFALVVLTALALAGVIPSVHYLAFLEKRALVADSLLALTLSAGVFAAAMGATATLGDEIRRRTALFVLAKPVSRTRFVVGKALGLFGALAALWLLLGVAALWGSRVAYDAYWVDTLATRVYWATLALGLVLAGAANYLFGRSFALSLITVLAVLLPLAFAGLGLFGFRGRPGPGWELVQWSLLPAVVLTLPAMLLAAGVALLAASRLEAVPTLLVTAAVFALGLVADVLLSRSSGWAVGAARVLVPDWQPFWVAESLARGERVPWGYVARAAGYAVTYTAALVTLTVAVFERREVT